MQARGLKAIHDHDTYSIVHRDFYSGNVLLDLSKSFEEENENSKSCYTLFVKINKIKIE